MMSVRKRLRARLGTGPMIIAPGISDAFGARLVEQAGFEVAYLGGNSVSALLLGQPDCGLIHSETGGNPSGVNALSDISG